ncbi:uncharacterized protein Z520_02393 [Fonsecaea multimorphosa CBS 102226]|uniref:(S)-ureidoglycine aminohydrolase cupin domain-containing protein n=1 Tax=Fonsecaea multimorphosa CBS 102226 TaxID=1442371 RepID=A0A0D2KFJ5_9EURO|nr:uncharacterized protein Z520_02393 [Fonsecaea multimorphosa CBS 102226]KIY02255.1 hypothetical protein Z520_02393 [Fonsecaea multimorphosa CBS 102226]OAL28903.1 hypothetical protein AYO22_02339 [Fonsecaea multimorphosa]
MPPSTPNLTGSSDPAATPYGNHTSFAWEAMPDWGGAKSIIYRSADGKVVAAAAKESGTGTLTYPCDEFFYVTAGWIKLNIHGGETFTLKTGDFVYLKKGTTVDFEFGDDFTNAAVFINDERITLM